MLELLSTVINFILVLGLLITIHEYGHFWVARRCGVKVLRFSVGFGQPLWRRVGADGVEYVIAAIPLGGYVKMVDEREAEVATADLPYAFNRRPLRQRVAIVAAGPIANLLLAVLSYWLMFMHGVEGTVPELAEPPPDTPAWYAGIEAGDLIVAVGEESVPTWQAALEKILPAALLREPLQLTLERGGVGQVVELPLHRLTTEVKPELFQTLTGIAPAPMSLPPVIGEVVSGSAAERAGMRAGDRIEQINQLAIHSWSEAVEQIKQHPEQPLTLVLRREGESVALEVTPEAQHHQGEKIGRLGVSLQVDSADIARYRAVWQYGVFDGLVAAVEKSWEMSILTLKVLGRMVTGSVSVENLSGPITIARYAKHSADAGLSQLLGFIAIVSLSLGILNLLPIPVLDGGHLFFYLLEWLRGAPLSERVEMVGQQVGISLLALLMMVAVYNDMVRLGWG
ncbi:RIP metalloprotease RseP [Ectothiorhodospiraceae bacterium BW-2]|nr:RIP metalloprotease RseP [Ectothiorhodospiraceae bacterium BW-2]